MKEESHPAAMPRRKFLKNASFLAFLATITVKVVGCDGEKYDVETVEPMATPRSDPTSSNAAEEKMDLSSEESDDPSPDPGPTPTPDPDPMPMMCSDISSTSSSDFGHTHPYTLSGSEQEAAAPVSLLLDCAGGHKHTVSLTGSEVASICAGSMVVKESTFDAGHTHAVMFNV